MNITLWTAVALAAVPLLVFINAFFVAAEFALVAVRRTKLDELVQAGRAGARAAQQANARIGSAIAATQLGVTLSSLALGWVGEPALADLLVPLFDFLPGGWQGIVAHSVAATFAFLFITFLHVVLGELTPKAIALQIPDRVCLLTAGLVLVFTRVTRPALVVMTGVGNAVLRLFGMKPASGEEMVHSVIELGMLIEETKRAGVISDDQARIVQNVFELTSKTVAEVMVPVDRMDSLELHLPPERVLEAVREKAHTRMPVYDTNPENIVGVVNTKDLFHLFSLRGLVLIEDAMYDATFVRSTEPVAHVLRRLRRLKRHMALVRDRDKNVVGLITLEDVLEEIVGEIEDEHDDARDL